MLVKGLKHSTEVLKKLKKFIKQALGKNYSKKLKVMFLKLFESKLGVILRRAKFSRKYKTGRQLIVRKNKSK